MRLVDIFRIALSTFRNNKMRTILTISGIAIGIGTIVFLFSFGYGLQKITIEEISSIKALTSYNITTGNSSILTINEDTLGKIKAISNVSSVYPALSLSGQISLDSSQTDIVSTLSSPAYVELDSPRLELGKYFSTDNEKSIVISSVVAQAFNMEPNQLLDKSLSVNFNMVSPDDKNKIINYKDSVVVIGIIKDASSSYGYLPINTFSLPKSVDYSSAKVQVNESKNMKVVKDKLSELGFQSSSIGERIDQMNKIFNFAKIVLTVLGAIALMVASIGMFNTLTISLLERTKDIGVMKALGATDGEINFIFLTESTLISFAGGVFGILLSFVVGTAINILIAVLAKQAGGEAVRLIQMPIYFVLFILIFSFLVGLLTGMYPARRAAKLNPLDALRYE